MNPEHWQEVKQLFHAALERAPESRAAFLDKACSGDESIRREVESLIKAHETEGSFIDSPAYEVAAKMLVDDQVELVAGQTFGHYKVLAPLGKGGMGEVYSAEDTRLGRRIALKLLPAYFTDDADRLRRFQQEARTASALNHPNILTIHEIGQVADRHFISTELIEGETLRELMRRGPLKTTEALGVAIQVASALAAAHAASIVHRDMKPENIMVRSDGIAKVLDFGLAKLTGMRNGTSGLRNEEAETLMQPSQSDPRSAFRNPQLTSPGLVMGTTQYMSPEQARGLAVDARTDIWSLGCVLYEMVAGRAPFAGETTSDVIAAILEREPPPLTKLTGDVPAELEWIIRKTLRKDREERYQTARELVGDLRSLKQRADFQTELDRTQSPEANASRPRAEDEKQFATDNVKRAAETSEVYPARSTETKSLTGTAGHRKRVVVFAALALVLGIISFAAYKFFGNRPSATTPQAAQNASEKLPELKAAQVTSWSGLDIFPSFSPDGNSIAYASDHNGSFEIYVKPLTPGGREIQLTSDGQENLEPAWSPDGKLVAYYSKKRGGIWLVPALGGTPRQLTDFGSYPSWSPDSSVIAFQSDGLADFGPTSTSVMPSSTIWSASVQGGAPKQLTHPGNPLGGHGAPSWSPDGKRIAFISSAGRGGGEIWSVSAGGDEVKQLSKQSGFDPVYAPDAESIYFPGGTGDSWALWRLHISPESGKPIGDPVMIKNTGAIIYKHLSISADGRKMACTALALANNLSSVTVSPASAEAKGSPVVLTQDTSYRKLTPAFSHDGKKIAYGLIRIGTNADIWVMDADGHNPMQLTTDPNNHYAPNWFPEGDRIAYLTERPGRQVRAINLQTGRDQLLFETNMDMGGLTLSPDGKKFAFSSPTNGALNLFTIAVEGGEARQLTFDRELMGFPCWSPDGQFLAFEMKRGEDTHVGIIPSDGGEPVQLTSDQGQSFTGSWSPDGERVAFAGERNGIWNIWWVSVKDKTEKQVTNYTKPNAYVRYPSWSPLGDRIVYEYAETAGNIWLIDLK